MNCGWKSNSCAYLPVSLTDVRIKTRFVFSESTTQECYSVITAPSADSMLTGYSDKSDDSRRAHE